MICPIDPCSSKVQSSHANSYPTGAELITITVANIYLLLKQTSYNPASKIPDCLFNACTNIIVVQKNWASVVSSLFRNVKYMMAGLLNNLLGF